jgi:hypothetical protein
MRMIHIGRGVKKFTKDGKWTEKSAIHLGHGVWIFELERNYGKREKGNTHTPTAVVEAPPEGMA